MLTTPDQQVRPRPRSLTWTSSTIQEQQPTRGQARVWTNRNLDRLSESQTFQGKGFSDGPRLMSKATNQCMSGVTMLILIGWVCKTVLLQEMHPLAKKTHSNKCLKQVISKATKSCPVCLAVHWIWPGMHPTGATFRGSCWTCHRIQKDQSSSQC